MAALARNKAFVGLGLASMLMAFSGYAIGMWNTAFLVRSHGLQLKDAGAIMGFIGGPAAIAGALLSGWLTDLMARRDKRWQVGMPILGTLISVPLGLAFYLNTSPQSWQLAGLQIPHAVAFYGLFAIFSSFWAAPVFAALTNVIAAHRLATSLSIYNLLLTAVGGGLGAVGGGTAQRCLHCWLRAGVTALGAGLHAGVLSAGGGNLCLGHQALRGAACSRKDGLSGIAAKLPQGWRSWQHRPLGPSIGAPVTKGLSPVQADDGCHRPAAEHESDCRHSEFRTTQGQTETGR